MQFQVPQFIEKEDSVVGPLSLRQFIFIAVGGGISAILFFILPMGIWIIFFLIIAITTLALAFIKINGRSFSNILISAFNFYWKPQIYIWKTEDLIQVKKEDSPTFGDAIQKIAEGISLHKSWGNIQAGVKTKVQTKQINEKYQVFRAREGDLRAIKRVDYR
jgi:hypothetical protein